MARVLVVDDAEFMRDMLSDIFSKDGHEIVGEAETAYEAVTLYRDLKPDLVTLDVVMPEIDGVNTIKAIREIMQFDNHARILVFSALGQLDLVVETIQAGAKDYITKPFQASKVSELVKRLTGESLDSLRVLPRFMRKKIASGIKYDER